MRKTPLFTIALISLQSLLHAQNTFPGTGNVGIGTLNPGYTLDVAGPVRLGGTGAYTNVLLGTDAIPFGNYNQTSYLMSPTIPGSGTARSAFRFKNTIEAGHGSNLLDIIVDGNVGVGTTTPGYPLDVNVSGSGVGLNVMRDHAANGSFTVSFPSQESTLNSTVSDMTFQLLGSEKMRLDAFSGGLQIGYVTNLPAGTGLAIAGNVGIGTSTPDPNSKLTVAGKIHSREVKVSVNAGADFVFDDSYKLKSLDETEQYINNNKHLPEIASAAEMKKNGLELGEMNIKLLQKIEELTLHMINFNKEMSAIKKENQILKAEVAGLKRK